MEHRRQIRQLVRSGQLLENLQFQETEAEEDQGEELSWDTESEEGPSMTAGHATTSMTYGAHFYCPPHLAGESTAMGWGWE
jgi:hypothetical protein